MPTSLLQQVIAMVADELDIDSCEIQPQSSFLADLMADSLDTANLLYASKIRFDVNISHEQADCIDTVQDLVDIIEKQQKG